MYGWSWSSTSFALLVVSFNLFTVVDGSHLKSSELWPGKCYSLNKTPRLGIQRKSKPITRNISVRSKYSDRSGGGGDFTAGFIIGGALFGVVGYIFAPQIRRTLLNEDEYGFRRARRPIYCDGGLEKTRQTLNKKISQLNSAIDNVSSRLRGRNKMPRVPVETDPEEATM